MLKFCAWVLLVPIALCLLVTQAGDNTYSRAIATIFWLPAIFFGVVDALLWLVVVLR